MSEHARSRAFLLLLLTIGLTVLIAAGLPGLELKPGLPFPSANNQPGGYAGLPGAPATAPIQAVVGLGVVLGLLMLYLVYKLLTGVPWREIAQPSIFFALLVLTVVGLLLSLVTLFPSSGVVEEEIYLPPTPEPILTAPLGDPPPGLAWLVWAGLALLIALLGVGALRWTRRAPAPDRVALELELALQALQNGLDLRSTIIRCYEQMSLALQQERGLEREQAMTAREFEQLLQQRGVPAGPVQQLTRLFEAARYSQRQPSTQEEQQAIECLSAILAYSRAGGPVRDGV